MRCKKRARRKGISVRASMALVHLQGLEPWAP